MTVRMHADELEVDATLVRSLLDAQFPQWSRQPLERVSAWGTDNAMFRLGSELLVRLPRRAVCVEGLQKELEWLPRLAPHLPVPVPTPVATGTPGEGYPWDWAVYRWLDGEPALDADVDYARLATDLAGFVGALQRVEVPAEPVPGSRGVPLRERDEPMRSAIARIDAQSSAGVDTAAVTAAWEAALAAPVWDGPPVWLHGDLMPMNLLIRDGALSGVVDFGTCTTGDPACEALAAWMTLTGETRGIFRDLLALDGATWARGRGWALSCAVIALPYYLGTYPGIVRVARRTIAEVLSDAG